MRAVLFDVGGPLNTEVTHERLMDADIRSALGSHGVSVDDLAYAQACQSAVDSFASNTYQAIIWYFARPDGSLGRQVYKEVRRKARERRTFELRAGMPELLAELHGCGLRLGLAANQPAAVLHELDAVGIGLYFEHREVSGIHGFLKPDPRLFLRACDELGVEPADCVMVGDRIDNDIAPAARLGMRTILLRSGRHRAQQPRTWDEVPDVEVHDVTELRSALLHLASSIL